MDEKAHFARSFNAKYERQLIVKSSATSTTVSQTSSSGIKLRSLIFQTFSKAHFSILLL